MVVRYVFIPFTIWIVTGISSFIFRWQSRKLMMTGYLEFYRRSSWVWKVSYAICSTAFSIGTTFFIIAQESISEQIHMSRIKERAAMDILFIFWSMTFVILLVLYVSLLIDYIRHNRRRMLPDGVNHTDYRALSEGTSVEAGKTSEVNDDIFKKKKSLSSGEHATLKRQAVTIRYLEKQLKLLMDQLLLTQQIRLPASRSLNDVLIQNRDSFSMQDFHQLCHENQILENECQNLRIQLQSNQEELAAHGRRFQTIQGIRQRLEKELGEAKDAIASKQSKVNELQILLNVQQKAADQARIFIENIRVNGNETTNT